MSSPKPECEELESRLADLVEKDLESSLDAGTRERLLAHARACKSCEESLRSYRSLLSGLHALSGTRAPADFAERVRLKIETEAAGGGSAPETPSKVVAGSRRFMGPAFLRLAALLLAASALATGLVLLNKRQEDVRIARAPAPEPRLLKEPTPAKSDAVMELAEGPRPSVAAPEADRGYGAERAPEADRADQGAGVGVPVDVASASKRQPEVPASTFASKLEMEISPRGERADFDQERLDTVVLRLSRQNLPRDNEDLLALMEAASTVAMEKPETRDVLEGTSHRRYISFDIDSARLPELEMTLSGYQSKAKRAVVRDERKEEGRAPLAPASRPAAPVSDSQAQKAAADPVVEKIGVQKRAQDSAGGARAAPSPRQEAQNHPAAGAAGGKPDSAVSLVSEGQKGSPTSQPPPAAAPASVPVTPEAESAATRAPTRVRAAARGAALEETGAAPEDGVVSEDKAATQDRARQKKIAAAKDTAVGSLAPGREQALPGAKEPLPLPPGAPPSGKRLRVEIVVDVD